MKNGKLWLMIAFTFLAGVFLGGAGTALYVRHMVGSVLAGGPPAVRKAVVRRLARELDLDRGQRAKMEEIVESVQTRLLEVRRENAPRIQAIFEDGLLETEKILDPAQREKARRLWEKVRGRWFLSDDSAAVRPTPDSPPRGGTRPTHPD